MALSAFNQGLHLMVADQQHSETIINLFVLELRMFFKAQAIHLHFFYFYFLSGLNLRFSALCAVFCEVKVKS